VTEPETRTLRVRCTVCGGRLHAVVAEVVASGLGVGPSLHTTRKPRRARGAHWVYHLESGLPVTQLDMTREQALEFAKVLGAWEVDWTAPQAEIRTRYDAGLPGRVLAEAQRIKDKEG